MNQGNLFDLPEGRKRRDKALASMSVSHADWVRHADWILQLVAIRQQFLSVNDIWAEGLPRDDRHSKALGSVFMVARTAGLIQKTDRTEQSKIPAHHARDVRIWRSLLYKGN